LRLPIVLRDTEFLNVGELSEAADSWPWPVRTATISQSSLKGAEAISDATTSAVRCSLRKQLKLEKRTKP
jgi:hypothetical protein